MNIVVLSGSPRRGGNTDLMAQAFAQGAEQAGHQVEVISLAGKKIAPCLACEYCFAHGGQCVQQDDMAAIMEQINGADLLCFASPIYWFNISAQLKCAIDRMYCRAKEGFRVKECVLLLNSGSPGVYDSAIAQYKDTNDYLGWKDRGIVAIGGMKSKGQMAQCPQLEEVRKLGASL